MYSITLIEYKQGEVSSSHMIELCECRTQVHKDILDDFVGVAGLVTLQAYHAFSRNQLTQSILGICIFQSEDFSNISNFNLKPSKCTLADRVPSLLDPLEFTFGFQQQGFDA